MWRGNVRTSEGKRQEQMSQTLEYELYDESTVHETAVLRQVSEIGISKHLPALVRRREFCSLIPWEKVQISRLKNDNRAKKKIQAHVADTPASITCFKRSENQRSKKNVTRKRSKRSESGGDRGREKFGGEEAQAGQESKKRGPFYILRDLESGTCPALFNIDSHLSISGSRLKRADMSVP